MSALTTGPAPPFMHSPFTTPLLRARRPAQADAKPVPQYWGHTHAHSTPRCHVAARAAERANARGRGRAQRGAGFPGGENAGQRPGRTAGERSTEGGGGGTWECPPRSDSFLVIGHMVSSASDPVLPPAEAAPGPARLSRVRRPPSWQTGPEPHGRKPHPAAPMPRPCPAAAATPAPGALAPLPLGQEEGSSTGHQGHASSYVAPRTPVYNPHPG